MVLKKYSICFLLLGSAIAMESSQVFPGPLPIMDDEPMEIVYYDDVAIEGTIHPSSTGWRWPLFRDTNKMSAFISPRVMYQEADSILIPYPDREGKCGYFSEIAHDNKQTRYVVSDTGELKIELPFLPRHLALNESKTILLIEGIPDVIKIGLGVLKPKNNALVAYALAQKKMYQLTEYTAPYGYETTDIGSNNGTAFARYGLTHQAWDISGIE